MDGVGLKGPVLLLVGHIEGWERAGIGNGGVLITRENEGERGRAP